MQNFQFITRSVFELSHCEIGNNDNDDNDDDTHSRIRVRDGKSFADKKYNISDKQK